MSSIVLFKTLLIIRKVAVFIPDFFHIYGLRKKGYRVENESQFITLRVKGKENLSNQSTHQGWEYRWVSSRRVWFRANHTISFALAEGMLCCACIRTLTGSDQLRLSFTTEDQWCTKCFCWLLPIIHVQGHCRKLITNQTSEMLLDPIVNFYP